MSSWEEAGIVVLGCFVAAAFIVLVVEPCLVATLYAYYDWSDGKWKQKQLDASKRD